MKISFFGDENEFKPVSLTYGLFDESLSLRRLNMQTLFILSLHAKEKKQTNPIKQTEGQFLQVLKVSAIFCLFLKIKRTEKFRSEIV